VLLLHLPQQVLPQLHRQVQARLLHLPLQVLPQQPQQVLVKLVLPHQLVLLQLPQQEWTADGPPLPRLLPARQQHHWGCLKQQQQCRAAGAAGAAGWLASRWAHCACLLSLLLRLQRQPPSPCMAQQRFQKQL
jgi:hypothetical protein